MQTRRTLVLGTLASVWLSLCLGSAAAEPVMMTEKWRNNNKGFAQCERRIQAGHARNLLARSGAKVAENGDLDPESLRVLTDGAAGQRAGDGRAMVDGQPTVITYYLGEPKLITEAGLFTFNGDARANQDYEVRFANNAEHPGQKPDFSDVHGTTGYKIVGANGGGFHTAFFDHQGGPLAPFKADWVQFRIWRTHNLRTGEPAKTQRASGWCAVVELEVLGTPGDVAEAKQGGKAPKLTPKLARRGKIQRMPRKPVYRKKETWQATMLASREAQIERDAELRKLAKAGKATAGLKPRLGTWFHIGPFKAKGKGGFGAQFPPEKQVDLEKSYDGKSWRPATKLTDGAVRKLRIPGNAAEYFYRTITVGQATVLPAWFGSDDGLAVWLNGEPIISKDARRGVSPNQDHAKLPLEAGTNHLLCKVYNGGGGSGFYFSTKPKPSGGKGLTADNAIWSLVERDFTSAEARRQMAWERRDGIWAQDWAPGDLSALAERYARHIPLPKFREQAQELANQVTDPASLDKVRQVYYQAKETREVVERAKGFQFEPLRRAVRDLTETFPERYPKGKDYLARLDALEKTLKDATEKADTDTVVAASKRLLSLREEALLANPLLNFQKLLVVKRPAETRKLGLPQNWQGNCALPRSGYDDELCVLSPVSPDGTLTTIYKPEKGDFVGDVELHFDGDRLMFSSLDENNRWAVYEMQVDPETGTADPESLHRVSPTDEPDVDWYDACYLPSGKIIFEGTACFHGVPCVGGGNTVANSFLLDPATGKVRQLTFDQDHNWCPTVLNNGRVLYSRWEYSDSPHYFTRLLFHMNPDGTEQMEYYASNSLWPNSTFYARPVPGHPTKVVGVISGHHGVPRMGELIIFDPAKGRHEADGAIQRIPGYGEKVEPVIRDGLVNGSWPRFLHPYPLGDYEAGRGSGKYFLVACKPTNQDNWGLYLVDIFDNMLKLADIPGYAIFEPIPFRKRPTPPVIPDKVNPDTDEAVVYLNDVYSGPGLDGVPRGTVKRLRIYEYHYTYPGRGGHINIGIDGPWDVHRIRGTVKVQDDGSALFNVPANIPFAVQPLDADGKALQVMRSWMTAMPGEVLSCAGCHERQNTSPSNRDPVALREPPQDIQPWHGPARGFSFIREVQPVLDKHCVGCHDGKKRPDGRTLPNFADTSRGWRGFNKSYIALHPYVRRPGPESDYHLQVPCEWHADTSELVQMLEKGHHGVTLDDEAWGRLITWIDLNVPCHGTWGEHRKIRGNMHERRLECRTQYANRPEDPEAYPGPPPERPDFVKPGPEPKPPAPVKLAGWPFDATEAKKRQANAGPPTELKLDLGEGVSLELALVPAGKFVMGSVDGRPDEWPETAVTIEQPFYMGRLEVTNEQFARFDPDHDSAYISVFNKDQSNRGVAVNRPHQPVLRVSWKQARAFCYWLSKKTGRAVSLPTEAQWEWACRAGTDTPIHYGAVDTGFGKLANFADDRLVRLCRRDSPKWIPHIAGVNDGATVTGRPERWQPNAWGLHAMHGNVAEWTRSTYKPYPYDPADGREKATPQGEKVVRGGSFYDRPKRGRSAFRLAYPSWRRVFNVGFRVVCTVEPKKVARK